MVAHRGDIELMVLQRPAPLVLPRVRLRLWAPVLSMAKVTGQLSAAQTEIAVGLRAPDAERDVVQFVTRLLEVTDYVSDRLVEDEVGVRLPTRPRRTVLAVVASLTDDLYRREPLGESFELANQRFHERIVLLVKPRI